MTSLAVPFFYVVMLIAAFSASAAYPKRSTTIRETSYVQPDGITFAIWGVIYTFLGLYSVYTTVGSTARNDPRVRDARIWTCLQFASNGAWLWTNAFSNKVGYWLAVFVLFGNVLCLLKAYVAVWRASPSSANDDWRWFAMVQTPVSLNLAWASIAAVANFSGTVFDPTALETNSAIVGGPDWTIGVLAVVGACAVGLLVVNGDVGFSASCAWAVFGIVRNQSDPSFPHPKSQALVECATALGIALLCAIPITVVFRRVFLKKQTAASSGYDVPLVDPKVVER